MRLVLIYTVFNSPDFDRLSDRDLFLIQDRMVNTQSRLELAVESFQELVCQMESGELEHSNLLSQTLSLSPSCCVW